MVLNYCCYYSLAIMHRVTAVKQVMKFTLLAGGGVMDQTCYAATHTLQSLSRACRSILESM